MQAPFSPDTVFKQSNRISSGSTIRKDGSLHRKSGSHRWQSAVADRYSKPARWYSCFGRVVQLDRADGTNSPLFTPRNQLTIIRHFRASVMLRTASALKRIGVRWTPQNANYKQNLRIRKSAGIFGAYHG